MCFGTLFSYTANRFQAATVNTWMGRPLRYATASDSIDHGLTWDEL